MENLSSVEIEIIERKAKGEYSKEIARRLNTTQKAVEDHLYRIHRKVGARNSENMIYLAIKKGLIT